MKYIRWDGALSRKRNQRESSSKWETF